MNLPITHISLSALCDFEKRRNDLFLISNFVKQNVTHLNLSWAQGHNITFKCEAGLYTLFERVGLILTFFYQTERFQFDQIEVDSLLESFSFFLLLVTVIIYWFETAFHSKGKKQKSAGLMVKLSNLSLTFLLITRWVTSHHFPLSNLYESLIFLSWSLTLIHLILEKISNTLLIGVLLSPITLFINGFALFTLPTEMQRGNFLTPALQSNWLMMHVTVMISSYAALLSGSVLAIAFLVVTRDINKNNDNRAVIATTHGASGTICTQDAKHGIDGTIDVKQKSPNLVLQSQVDPTFLGSENKLLSSNSKNLLAIPQRRLNSFFQEETILQNQTNLARTLDNLSYRTIGIGFPLLTIGILSGSVWANEAWGSYWSWDPKETWALITWFLFAIYLHTRITKGLQGEKPAIIATIGFVVVWVCFLGVNLASQGLHTYGWLQ